MDLKKVMNNLNLKKLKKRQILILFLCGVLMMIIATPMKEKDADKDIYEAEEEMASSDSTAYVQYLENRLENILSQMDGAGRVVCMITLAQSAEQIVEKDIERSDDMVSETDSQGGTRTTDQSSKAETTVYDEGDNGKPYVSKEISPQVEGVLVIAEGGDNAVVVKNITESIQALFGIESHKIRIVKKGGN